MFVPSHQGGDRLSPGSLDMRLAAELNRLEYMEESVRQLTDVERTRAVSMAQQETVSLAQILKVSTSLKSYRIVFRDEKGELQTSFALASSCPCHKLPDSNLIY